VQRIAVLDYGMGNLRSVSKALEAVAPDDDVIVTADPALIGDADRIVCPGQGAARDCMAALDASGLSGVIRDSIGTRPFLGICMGLQVLLTHSDENGGVACLDVIAGQVLRFADPLLSVAPNPPTAGQTPQRLKVPHMGWSPVHQALDHPLWSGIEDLARFYFAHSYFVQSASPSLVAATCCYGGEFAAALAIDDIFACQFHPEKSADDGLQLLRNFTRWSGGGT